MKLQKDTRKIWLSANDTRRFASGYYGTGRWPCSALAGRQRSARSAAPRSTECWCRDRLSRRAREFSNGRLSECGFSRRRRRTGVDRASGDGAVRRPPLLPLFIVLFLVAVAIRSTGVLSTPVLGHLKDLETLLLGMGLFGLGCNVDVRRLRKVGGRPLALGLLAWVLVAAVSLVAVSVAGV